MKCLVAVVGPTAVGKSRLGISIAKRFNGEIVNADSRQIYKYMDIGTAKPGRAEREEIGHHMLDIILPDQPYNLALYQESACKCIGDIQGAGRLPVLVGGSGQYVWSVLEGWRIPAVAPDPVFRESMERRAESESVNSLYRELEKIDPASAARISPNNLRRIVRALEIYHKGGILPSSLREKRGLPYPVLIIGLTAGREHLYSLIDGRVERMVEAGLVEEVKNLLDMGYHSGLASMSSLGYRQMADHLGGKMGLQEAVQTIRYETHRFARNQYAWFRSSDGRIEWFDTDDGPADKAMEATLHFLETSGHA
jgi:tRNA dimethylallyltransferase